MLRSPNLNELAEGLLESLWSIFDEATSKTVFKEKNGINTEKIKNKLKEVKPTDYFQSLWITQL